MSRAPVFWRLGSGVPPSGAHVAVVPGAQAPLLALELPDGLRGIARERVAQRQLVEQLSSRAEAFEMLPFLPKGAKRWTRVLVADAEQAGVNTSGVDRYLNLLLNNADLAKGFSDG